MWGGEDGPCSHTQTSCRLKRSRWGLHLSMLASASCAEALTHLAMAVKLLPLATSTRHFLHSLMASDSELCEGCACEGWLCVS